VQRPRLALTVLAVLALAGVAVLASQAVARPGHVLRGATATASAATPAAQSAGPVVEKKTIGYVTIFGDPVQLRFARVFQAAAKAVGWKVIFQDARGQPAQALRIMQNFVNQKVDAIVSSSVETSYVKSALADAKAKGIPVIATGATIGGNLKSWTAVYVESEQGLSTALAKYVVAQSPPGGKSHLGIIWNNEYLPGTLRYRFFQKALASSKYKATQQHTVSATDPTQGSQNAASAMLSADPQISAILAIFDWMAPPAITAIHAAGRTDVSVYSYYADNTNLPLLEQANSPLKAVVDGNVEEVCAVALDQLLRHFVLGKPFAPNAASAIKFKYTVYTKANAPKFSKSYLGPVSVSSVVSPWLAKWKKEYTIK
jgi:ribose transport system substrate-binding protein